MHFEDLTLHWPCIAFTTGKTDLIHCMFHCSIVFILRYCLILLSYSPIRLNLCFKSDWFHSVLNVCTMPLKNICADTVTISHFFENSQTTNSKISHKLQLPASQPKGSQVYCPNTLTCESGCKEWWRAPMRLSLWQYQNLFWIVSSKSRHSILWTAWAKLMWYTACKNGSPMRAPGTPLQKWCQNDVALITGWFYLLQTPNLNQWTNQSSVHLEQLNVLTYRGMDTKERKSRKGCKKCSCILNLCVLSTLEKWKVSQAFISLDPYSSLLKDYTVASVLDEPCFNSCFKTSELLFRVHMFS